MSFVWYVSSLPSWLKIYDFRVAIYDARVAIYDVRATIYDFRVAIYDFGGTPYDFRVANRRLLRYNLPFSGLQSTTSGLQIDDFCVTIYDFRAAIYDLLWIANLRFHHSVLPRKHGHPSGVRRGRREDVPQRDQLDEADRS